jgi:hypothetical protein
MQESEAKRKRAQKQERETGRRLPNSAQLYAEIQAMPDDDEDLGNRRSGTPSPRSAG